LEPAGRFDDLQACRPARSAGQPDQEERMNTKVLNANDERFALALGEAVIAAWGKLPKDIQEVIFEQAVRAGHRDERDESLREQLAVFLHEHHPRTG
jgi:hypothetical protein